ncbi:MAG: heparinase II/III family protein, partial [Acidobacteria bacterium]|nr:heparinase II/III family protein [Acidobacteriota bacterium]
MLNCTRRSLFGASAAAFVSLPLAGSVAPTLSGGWSAEKLAGVLLRPGDWKPFPTASERSGWDSVPEDSRKALVAAAEPHLHGEWLSLPASLLLGFVRKGNRTEYESVRNQRRHRLSTLAVAECVEGKGRFLDDILNGLWVTLEETWWGVPAPLGMQKAGTGLPDVLDPVVDLFAAETSSELAWVDYLLAAQLEKLSPLLRKRIHYEIERRVLAVNRQRSDFAWMGFRDAAKPPNNWNPWINSNWLASTLLVETDQARRAEAVYKILTSLDRFLAGYAPDGGCDEGPGYWSRAGASLFDNLDLLYSASAGRVDYFGQPLIHEIGRYICRAHIHDNWYINFADATAKMTVDADLLFRYGRAVKDPEMQMLGAWSAQEAKSSRGGSIGRQLAAIFNQEALRQAPKGQALMRDSWFAGIQVMAARRKEGSAEGLYLAAQGGHNMESHNHNDVGNFIVYADGKPVIIDIGVETYSAKTFSAQRYDIWTMQSAWHNLPTVDGVMQS